MVVSSWLADECGSNFSDKLVNTAFNSDWDFYLQRTFFVKRGSWYFILFTWRLFIAIVIKKAAGKKDYEEPFLPAAFTELNLILLDLKQFPVE
ncbi:hypothetical protein I569_02186 [Enterococcus dispar ATCC 51266]|uniref:Uncharacterized protein n=1 Tax=Enterococcus dispar ATCC 51266 TaxID=1139219 RepID=S1NM98_9ENTE|nr:hypothetical protein OMK_01720 [Enterococcus dispar ATCC 51266]EOW86823.1 hypothetical protein I569_02186 [Enterococcus dispar ATCC 51266]